MSIDWFTFAAQIVNFVVLIWLLNRFLYEPITKAMQSRQETVAQQLSAAEEQKREAEREKLDFQQAKQELETERQQIFAAAHEEAAKTKQNLLNEARSDVQSRREDWLHSLQREQESLVATVQARASQQVVSATRSALTQLADVDLQDRMLTCFVAKLQALEPDKLPLLRQESGSGNRAVLETAFDVSPQWQEKLQTELRQLGLKEVEFVTDPELVCGIELHVGGQKIGWSVQEYLTTLSDELVARWTSA